MRLGSTIECGKHGRGSSESGLATLIALIALSVFSLLGLYLSLDAAVEVRLSDNYEAHLQSSVAARAGLEHAGELLRGLEFDDLLKGPDGTYDSDMASLLVARTYAYRNPLPWAEALSLDIGDPSGAIMGLSDDGVLNTGRYGISEGTILIPLSGIAFMAPSSYGSGPIITARYFVKASDNNGEASERARDPEDSPFLDGDGIVVIRSMGVSRTLRETMGTVARYNSVTVFEARYKRTRTLDLDAALVILGNDIAPSGQAMFTGSTFRIDGGSKIGMALIDTVPSDGSFPEQLVTSALGEEQYDTIVGAGIRPSIQDVTGSISTDADRALLLSSGFLWDVANRILMRSADQIFYGNQTWISGDTLDLGLFDVAKEPNDPAQNPRLTIVDGSLEVNGRISGAGLLLVKGKLGGSGSLNYTGLILVLGAGDADMNGLELSLTGGMFIANLTGAAGSAAVGNPRLSIGRTSSLVYARGALEMARRLIAPSRISWREITTTLDP